MDAPWAAEVKAVERALGTSLKKGLSDEKVAALREEHGWNELEQEEGSSFWDMVLEQFDDPLVKILLVAALVSAGIAGYEMHELGLPFSVGLFVEPLVILLILFLNAAVGVYQESNAEKSLEALKEMQPDRCRVMREGASLEIGARELVPGDVVECRVGDKVPADLRVGQLRTTTLRLEQMALTGESVSVGKVEEPIAKADSDIQSKSCMMFAGTTVSNGTVMGIVTHTGMNTEVGKIQEQLQAAAAERAEEKTPLKQKLEDFSDQLQNIILVICLAVWLINIRMFVDFEEGSIDLKKAIYYFQIAVALAVAAVPEGLPTVITMCLALGTRKMAKRNAIVRKLPAVETLGCTSVICSDKTGTLTTNQMSVRHLVTCGRSDSDLVEANVSGSTYDPTDGVVELGKGGLSVAVRRLAQICSLCNESTVERDPKKGLWRHVGAPTEAALTVLVEKLLEEEASQATPMPQDPGSDSDVPCNARLQAAAPNVATLEFTRDRKSMSVLVDVSGGAKKAKKKNELLVKGAPESLLERCTHALKADGKRVALSAGGRRALEREIEKFAGMALRCLGMAYSDELGHLADYDGPHHHAAKQLSDPANFAEVEQGLTWVGLVAMQDPPRAEVRDSMIACRNAGVRVIVITGDNKITAEAICRDIGVFSEDEDISGKSFVGHEFSKLSKKRQNAVLQEDAMGGLVFSRAEPKFKQDIVRLLQQQNCVVAMTGDGVNDAPALKMADIGIAMGISGTEVAKEASDFVLADDNFSTIVGAVEEGRSIAENMAAFVRYMISSNVGEVFSIFFVAALGLPEGMVPVQLLWVNLVTDGPPATALGFNRADPDIMTKPPRDKDAPLINNWVLFRYLVVGVYVGFATVGAFVTWFMHGVGSEPFLGFLDLSEDGHTSVTFEQLSNWDKCDLETNMFAIGDTPPYKFQANDWTAGGLTYSMNGCDFFADEGKAKASTLSLTVLVTIEMFNAFNALSENGSLLYHVLPWDNVYLLAAMGLSFALHALILYVPALCPIFQVVPLSVNEWILVIVYSFPVIVIEEILKIFGRGMEAKERAAREKAWNERIGKKTN